MAPAKKAASSTRATSPKKAASSTKAAPLAKATLTPAPGESGVQAIEFMFNPTELSFEGVVETADNPGAGSEKTGKPKVSFSNIKAYKITINNILFDTYENQAERNVLKKYIEPFKNAVKFIAGKERPPIYMFSWGAEQYLKYCFVERLSYKLTMFLPDGTPVRAVIDNLTLKETDGSPKDNSKPPSPSPTPADTMPSRQTSNRNTPQQ